MKGDIRALYIERDEGNNCWEMFVVEEAQDGSEHHERLCDIFGTVSGFTLEGTATQMASILAEAFGCPYVGVRTLSGYTMGEKWPALPDRA